MPTATSRPPVAWAAASGSAATANACAGLSSWIVVRAWRAAVVVLPDARGPTTASAGSSASRSPMSRSAKRGTYGVTDVTIPDYRFSTVDNAEICRLLMSEFDRSSWRCSTDRDWPWRCPCSSCAGRAVAVSRPALLRGLVRRKRIFCKNKPARMFTLRQIRFRWSSVVFVAKRVTGSLEVNTRVGGLPGSWLDR